MAETEFITRISSQGVTAKGRVLLAARRGGAEQINTDVVVIMCEIRGIVDRLIDVVGIRRVRRQNSR
jgi:hypothetical protein